MNTITQWSRSQALQEGWKSQEERRLQMKEKHASMLKPISIQEREELFSNIKKGSNLEGGRWGKLNCTRQTRNSSQTFYNPGATLKAASWTRSHSGQRGWGTSVQDPHASGQKYQFDQNCPIIVRGNANIDPNHLAIRNINGDISSPVAIPTWKTHMLKNTLRKI